MVQIEIWQFILIILITIILAAVATFFITRKIFARQIQKNPPINEDMIRAMMTQMGRTPSEKQVRAVMRSMNDAAPEDKKIKPNNKKK
ncbi:MAG: YneF family protein [Acholeplasmatales bacterium]|nr:YneF family protein [Acholeplasmatales bacterium]